jgi:hypothetical protein
MGDKSLMKKILLILLTLTFVLNADLSVKQIQEMVYKIHQKREGIKLATLETTEEPFISIAENNVTNLLQLKEGNSAARLDLHAIVNGKAYINNSWMDINESVLGYQLKFIGKRGVVLRNENHIKKLFLRKQKDSFIKFEGR